MMFKITTFFFSNNYNLVTTQKMLWSWLEAEQKLMVPVFD